MAASTASAASATSQPPRPAPLPVFVGFVKYYDKGSTEMSAHQIADGLAKRGWDARPIYAREVLRVRRSILIFIKTSRLDHLLVARARGNRLALDVHDTVVFKRHIKNQWFFHSLILKSERQLADFGRPERGGPGGQGGKLDRILYHQWDERYFPNRAPQDRVSVAYLGLPRSIDFWGEIPGVEYLSHGRMFEEAPRFNCHLSIRRPGREFLYKPNCKVSTAAACEAVLVTTRDLSTVEMLGEDYPFYCEPDRPSIVAALERVRGALGSPEWCLALERLKAVRERTSMDRILDDYEDLLRDLAQPLLS